VIAWGMVAIVMVGTLVLALAIALIATQRKGERTDRIEELRELGFVVRSKPPRDKRAGLFEPFEGVPGLSTGAKGLLMHAQSDVDEMPVTLIRHSYMTLAGQTPIPVHHAVAGVACPQSWPVVRLKRRLGLFGFFGRGGPQLDREPFNKRWRVYTDDEEFAIMLLTPVIQAWLEDAPRKESWRIGGGWVHCIWDGDPRGPDLKLLSRRPSRLRSMTPFELDAFGV